MRFNLNDDSLGGNTAVFNDGIAGKVDNVTIEIVKKKIEESDNSPDYKMFFTDDKKAKVNQGFYYYQDKDDLSPEENHKKAGYTISRILSAAKAVVPTDFKFPEVADKSANEIIDMLFEIISENQEGVKVNVFCTYGTVRSPKRFLNPRYFDYIEKANTEGFTRLRKKGDDLMSLIVEDESSNNSNVGSGMSTDDMSWLKED